MKYTIEEKNLIADEAKEIETWIEDNIVPYIVDQDVSVSYGDDYYEINISKSDIKIRNIFSSGNNIYLSQRNKNYIYYTAVATLILNWNETKKRLLQHLDYLSQSRKRFVEELKNFKI